MGHQLLSYLTSGYDDNVITPVTGEGAIVNTLQFISRDSYILTNWTEENYQSATTGNGVLYYNHHWAVNLNYPDMNS